MTSIKSSQVREYSFSHGRIIDQVVRILAHMVPIAIKVVQKYTVSLIIIIHFSINEKQAEVVDSNV